MFSAGGIALITEDEPLDSLGINCGSLDKGVSGCGTTDFSGEVPLDGLCIDCGVSLGDGAWATVNAFGWSSYQLWSDGPGDTGLPLIVQLLLGDQPRALNLSAGLISLDLVNLRCFPCYISLQFQLTLSDNHLSFFSFHLL